MSDLQYNDDSYDDYDDSYDTVSENDFFDHKEAGHDMRYWMNQSDWRNIRIRCNKPLNKAVVCWTRMKMERYCSGYVNRTYFLKQETTWLEKRFFCYISKVEFWFRMSKLNEWAHKNAKLL